MSKTQGRKPFLRGCFSLLRLSPVPLALLAILLCSSSSLRCARALVISNSRLEVCENRGNEPRSFRTGGVCNKKLIMTLSIGSDEVIPEVVEVNRYTEDGVEKPLGQRFRIYPSKSPVHVMYPLSYKASINAKPWEKWFKVKRNDLQVFLNVKKCNDAPNAKNPTCGVFTRGDERIPHSQGFCCTCSDEDILGGGSTWNSNRGNLGCGLWTRHRSSAHCLRFHNNWYDVWEMERAYVLHTIRLVIYRETSYNGTLPEVNQACRDLNAQPLHNQGTVFYCYDVLNIGVQQKVARSDNGTIIATYVGDLLPSIMPHDLSDKYLVAPNYHHFPNRSDPMQFYVNKPAFWMIFDKTEVDITGSTCNKPGVYFTAFRAHGISHGCALQPHACLYNQPYDIALNDLFRLSEGRQPNHLVQRYGRPRLRSSDERSHIMSFEQDAGQDSIYTLEIDADDSRIFVLDLHFDIMETAVYGLASVSRDIFLWVEVARVDFRPGTVYVSVFCSENVLPVPTAAYSWGFEGDGHLGDIVVPLRTTSTKALTHKCRIEARNARGRLTETAEVAFKTTATCACLGLCECTCVDDQPVACWDDDEPLGSDFDLDQGDDDDWLGLDGLGDRISKLFDFLGLDFNDLLGLLAGLFGLGALAACFKLGLLPVILSCLFRRLCSCFGCGCGGDDGDDDDDDENNNSSSSSRNNNGARTRNNGKSSNSNNKTSSKGRKGTRNGRGRSGKASSGSSDDEDAADGTKSKHGRRFGEATASGKPAPGGGKLPRRQLSRTSVRKHRVGTDSDAWMNNVMKRHNHPLARLSRLTSALSLASRTSRHVQRDSDDDDNGYLTVDHVTPATSLCSNTHRRKQRPDASASLEGHAAPQNGARVSSHEQTARTRRAGSHAAGEDDNAEVFDELFRVEHIQFAGGQQTAEERKETADAQATPRAH